METRTTEWDASYSRNENFVYEPADEVVRFISKYLRKRVGINEFQSREKYKGQVKLLDVGCGVGRHLKIGHRFGFEVHGIELSQVAVNHALAFLESEIGVDFKDHIVCGDATKMPWDPEFFDAAVSDSVLDSMDYSIAEEVVGEVSRSLKSGGLFYLSLISFRDDAGILRKEQVVVEGDHEAGTIQSYFDEKKIRLMLSHSFEVVELKLLEEWVPSTLSKQGRWHVVARKKS